MPNMERDWEELKEELKPIISFTFVYGIVSYLEHLGYQEVGKLVSCTLFALNLVTGLILLVFYTMTPRYLQVCLFVCFSQNLCSRGRRQLAAWRWRRTRLHQDLAIVSRLRCRLVEEDEPEAWCPICYADYAAGDKVFHHFILISSSPSLQLMYPGCHDLHVAHSACLREWFARSLTHRCPSFF